MSRHTGFANLPLHPGRAPAWLFGRMTRLAREIWGTPTSTRDPARFAFAHGGKDGTPFPVDRTTYDRTIDVLHRAMARAHVDRSEKVGALKRLGAFAKATEPRGEERGARGELSPSA